MIIQRYIDGTRKGKKRPCTNKVVLEQHAEEKDFHKSQTLSKKLTHSKKKKVKSTVTQPIFYFEDWQSVSS